MLSRLIVKVNATDVEPKYRNWIFVRAIGQLPGSGSDTICNVRLETAINRAILGSSHEAEEDGGLSLSAFEKLGNSEKGGIFPMDDYSACGKAGNIPKLCVLKRSLLKI